MATPDVDDLNKNLTNRYNQIRDLYFSGKRSLAFTMAEDLVREPGLCANHEAGMHQLLTCHPFNDDTIMHAQEVVRIDSEIVQKYHDTATMHEQAFKQTKLRFAKEHLQLVLEKKRKFDENIASWISAEFVKVDAPDAQIELAERDEQAERPAAPEDDNNLVLNAPPDTTRRTDETSQDQPQSTARVDAVSPRDLHIHTPDEEEL
ncbi:hypothetical protein COL922a_007480 [Colletotrichum nupharicola]|nr:hypothetical protein COL922a_007480 [Colletotrichum nupharicola]